MAGDMTAAEADWPAEHITVHLLTIMSASIDELEAAAPA